MNEETTTILIDTALAAGSASALDPEERALQELVLAVRDDAPIPAPDFRLRMDARVAAGFPARRARSRRLPAFPFRQPRLAALGAVASLLIAVVVAGSLSGGGSTTNPVGVTTPSVARVESAPSPAGAARRAPLKAQRHIFGVPAVKAAPNGASVGAVRGGQHRQVERSAALTLGAPKDKLNDVGDQVVGVTDRYRGIVMRSSVTSGSGQEAGGSFDLRIPVRSLAPALRDLSALADVQSRTENADDVTSSFVSARTRIQELNAQRNSLLKRLANAQTDTAANQLRYEISQVNSELNYETHRLQSLGRRVAYATVSVTLVAEQGGATGGSGIDRGWRDLRHSLVRSADIALRVLGVAIPIAVLVALLWAGNAWATRRRREAALDSRL